MTPRDRTYLAALVRAHLLSPSDEGDDAPGEETALDEALRLAAVRLGVSDDLADLQAAETASLAAEGLL